MRSYPPFKSGQVILAIAIGFAIVLGSLVHSAWAAPGQQPERQSVPTSPYTPTPTKAPKKEKRPTATPTAATPPTPTVAAPLLPKAGAQAVPPQQVEPQASVALERAALALLGGGLALLCGGLWLQTRQRRSVRRRPGARR